nr:BA14K family protein [Sinorhizobium medicae]
MPKEGEVPVKAIATLAIAVFAAAIGIPPAESQTCSTGICAGGPGGSTNHNLFIEREYRDFLQQRYPNYGSRYRGGSPDISIGPGATVGGPLHNRPRLRQRQKVFDANAHLRWCQERYNSYRLSDDTFQPFRGGRRPCNSPYN